MQDNCTTKVPLPLLEPSSFYDGLNMSHSDLWRRFDEDRGTNKQTNERRHGNPKTTAFGYWAKLSVAPPSVPTRFCLVIMQVYRVGSVV
jgi:hypothetical protein